MAHFVCIFLNRSTTTHPQLTLWVLLMVIFGIFVNCFWSYLLVDLFNWFLLVFSIYSFSAKWVFLKWVFGVFCSFSAKWVFLKWVFFIDQWHGYSRWISTTSWTKIRRGSRRIHRPFLHISPDLDDVHRPFLRIPYTILERKKNEEEKKRSVLFLYFFKKKQILILATWVRIRWLKIYNFPF